ncbi:hypothetical protein BDW74DRAFT_122346 [Aspergillus multicolor]|uniref:uncharacterized protein n=1 Tax=Aspergillus multicolor TaxID=41759 RepID=UPI003CCE41B8
MSTIDTTALGDGYSSLQTPIIPGLYWFAGAYLGFHDSMAFTFLIFGDVTAHRTIYGYPIRPIVQGTQTTNGLTRQIE